MSSEALLDSRLPIVAAPMAGGPTTVALAAAVADAGAFPFLAAGYKTPESLAGEIEELRVPGRSFGVNLFVPGESAFELESFREYAASLRAEADIYGLTLDPEPVEDDDHWTEKVELLLADPVPVVSFTFALPDPAVISAFGDAGTITLATVTTPGEAELARDGGIHGLVVQGPSAGGHSGTWDPERYPPDVATEELVRSAIDSTGLPVIAGGGIGGPDGVRHLLDSGAEGVAVGTLLLLADEAGTNPTHREALVDPEYGETVLTRAFTGRPARGLRNGFIEQHEAEAPFGYPQIHHLTRPLRQAAAKAGDSERLHLWAGTGFRAAPARPAADVIAWLAGETA